jgi:ribosomal protein RSM22 (predicted rRNA methylase)
VERSSLHRRVKGGELGHEDEKFSYIALARDPVKLPDARIIRHPRHHPGLIEIETCTPEGLRSERIAKRDRDRFRAARKASWGDAAKAAWGDVAKAAWGDAAKTAWGDAAKAPPGDAGIS